MWKLIHQNLEIQFDGEFSDGLHMVFGIHRDEVRQLPQTKYGKDPESSQKLACCSP